MSRTVAVTGASRGIGRAIAQRFLAEGWEVWALVRTPEALGDLGANLPAGAALHPLAFDAAAEANVVEAAQRLLKEAPQLEVLVNNAGISYSAPLAKTTAIELKRLMAINFTAPYLLCREL